MPQCVSYQPKRLLEICTDYAAINISRSFKNQDEARLKSIQRTVMFTELPDYVYQIVLDRILELDLLSHDNYENILCEKAYRLMFKMESFKVSWHSSLILFLQDHCKNVRKIDLSSLFSRKRWVYDKDMVNMLKSMVHLEWANLKNCKVTDWYFRFIGAKCTKLRYLNIEGCKNVTDKGIRALCDPTMATKLGSCRQLTHLYLGGVDKITPKGVSLVLLNCPDLEVLESRCTEKALAEAIFALGGSAAIKWWDNTECKVDPCADSGAEPCRTFKLKNLRFVCDSKAQQHAQPFFTAVAKYCPHLEDLTLVSSVFAPGVLDGICSLKLRSLCHY